MTEKICFKPSSEDREWCRRYTYSEQHG